MPLPLRRFASQDVDGTLANGKLYKHFAPTRDATVGKTGSSFTYKDCAMELPPSATVKGRIPVYYPSVFGEVVCTSETQDGFTVKLACPRGAEDQVKSCYNMQLHTLQHILDTEVFEDINVIRNYTDWIIGEDIRPGTVMGLWVHLLRLDKYVNGSLQRPAQSEANEPLRRGTLHQFFPTVTVDATARGSQVEPIEAHATAWLAVVHPKRTTASRTTPNPGFRADRDVPLQVEHLWLGSGDGPPHMETVQEVACCALCLQIISHPVFYACGHSHCYTCVRIWLEEQWDCPECKVPMTAPPFRVPRFEDLMQKVYGNWDTSVVEYDWSGLTFPEVVASVQLGS
ncbi:hypothetical protein B0H13DRAFT_1855735 [Mycena leptocephala]|nr:hypothetical protein B0H13DRAFT_1855735 [Mycena leptocephala]